MTATIDSPRWFVQWNGHQLHIERDGNSLYITGHWLRRAMNNQDTATRVTYKGYDSGWQEYESE